jgi:hypothetical protein
MLGFDISQKVWRPIFLVMMLVSQLSLLSQNTFECDGTMYFNYGNINSNGTVYIGEYDTTSASTSTTIASNTTFNHNALAYNYLDNYLYAVGNPSRIFYRINSSGTYTSLGTVSGVDPNNNIYAGDFNESGVYVLSGHVNDAKIYRVDMTGSSPSLISSVTRTYSSGSGIPDFADIVFNRVDSTFYGLDKGTGKFHSINPINGVATPISSNQAGPYVLGALFFGEDYEYLYGHGRATQTGQTTRLYRCDLSTGTCTYIANGQNSFGNADGCACHDYCSDTTLQVSVYKCPGDSFVIDDTVFYASNEYTQEFASYEGCDSLVVYDIVFEESINTEVEVNKCSEDSFIVGDTVLYTTQVYSQTYTSASGCDSTVIYDVEFEDSLTVEADTFVCTGDTIHWKNQVISQSGTYNHTVISDITCDSTYILNVQTGIASISAALQSNQNLTYTTTGGTFIGWVDCGTGAFVSTNDTFTTGLSGHSYAAVAQDSSCTDTSNCILIKTLSNSELNKERISVFPNPSRSGAFTIVSEEGAISAYQIYTVEGVLIQSVEETSSSNSAIGIIPATGVYFLHVHTSLGKVSVVRLLVTK